jgi:hypothetical protein
MRGGHTLAGAHMRRTHIFMQCWRVYAWRAHASGRAYAQNAYICAVLACICVRALVCPGRAWRPSPRGPAQDMCTCVRACVCVSLAWWSCTWLYICACVCMHVCMYACMHVCITRLVVLHLVLRARHKQSADYNDTKQTGRLSSRHKVSQRDEESDGCKPGK